MFSSHFLQGGCTGRPAPVLFACNKLITFWDKTPMITFPLYFFFSLQVVVSCLLNFFGILACILGMIFVVAFGIANCNKKTSNRDHTNLGFCSYSVNTGENYTTAVLSLILIILVFISNFFSFYIFSKYSDALITRKKNNPSQSETDINTVSVATEFSNVVTDEQRRSDVIAQLQVQDLQQRNMDSQCEESILETNIQLPPYPGQTAPPPPYTIQTTELSDFTNPMNHDSLLAESTADLPPSYESVLYHAGTEQVSVIGQS